MKKVLILAVILLMLFFILCSFSFGQPSGTRGESVKGNPMPCRHHGFQGTPEEVRIEGDQL